MGHGIHVPARVMGQFVVFCPAYGSCFVNFALFMGSYCKISPGYAYLFSK